MIVTESKENLVQDLEQHGYDLLRPPPAYRIGEIEPPYESANSRQNGAGPSTSSAGTSSDSNRTFEVRDEENVIRLEVYSRFQNQDPTYEPGDEVRGTLHVGLPKAQKIKSINLYFKGRSRTRIVIPRGESSEIRTERWLIFDDERKFSWNEINAQNYTMEGDKLGAGVYTFPFTFRLPIHGEYVRTPDLKQRRSHPPERVAYEMLPPSCVVSYQGSYSRIVYHLKVEVERGGIHLNYKLKFPFLVSPKASQIPRSKLMAEAMIQDIFPPSPDIDPDGWEVTEQEVIVKTTFGGTLGRLSVQVNLPKPCSYPIGVPIPFVLRIDFLGGKKDEKILKKIDVILNRHLLLKVPYITRFTRRPKGEGIMDRITIGERNVEPNEVSFHSRDIVKTFFGYLPCSGVPPTVETPNIKIDWKLLIDLTVPGILNNQKIEIPIRLTPNINAMIMPARYV